VDHPGQIVQLAMCDGDETNVVTVTLTPERQRQVAAHLDRRGYISQTSCGLCGKTLVDELHQALKPLDDTTTIKLHEAHQSLHNIDQYQLLYHSNATSHAAALLDKDLNLLVAMEDVGRHNALDKAIGRLFLDHRLHLAKVLVMSSRISYELVQKAARARIPIFLAHSRPTDMAINLAARLNITLASAGRPAGLHLFCNTHRFGLQNE
jgi:FdhD protein